LSFRSHRGKYLKPVIKTIGGKQKTRDRLYPYFPSECHTYLEPFIGSGAVLVGNPNSYSVEYANDSNQDIVNFYNQVIERPMELYSYYCRDFLTLDGSHESWYAFRDAEPSRDDHLNRASWFYIINKSCMNGILRYRKDGKCNSSYCKTLKGRGWMTTEWIQAVSKRLADVQFSNLDFKDFLQSYMDLAGTFVFLDPPYAERTKDNPDGCVTVYNGKRFTLADQEDLAAILKSAKFKWLMTLNDCQWTRDAYKDFNIKDNWIQYSCSQTSAGRKLTKEVIIANYELGDSVGQ
jgi:DNA adenine methylase